MKYVITIGRQYGSGGRFIAQKLAKELNIAFYDNEILAKTAEDSGYSKEVIKDYDEKKEGFFSGVVPTTFGVDLSLGQKVFLAQFETIKKIASEESCVIVGRCADYILQDHKNLCSVFIYSQMENRIDRVVKYYGVLPAKAKDTINKKDKARASYYNFYTDKKWSDIDSYDIALNSAIGIDEAVCVIKTLVEQKMKENEEE